MVGNNIAYAQMVVNGKNANGEYYSYFYDFPYPGATVIDSVQLRVNYITDFAIDTAADLRIRETSTLEIGKRLSKFYHHQYFLTDSLLKHRSDANKATGLLYENVSYPLSILEAIYMNYPEGKLTCTGKVLTQDFMYKEDMPEMEWNLTDSTKSILGMTCYMATCSFRGRDYTVWFTPDIPVMAGPWKFSGLPGLILEA